MKTFAMGHTGPELLDAAIVAIVYDEKRQR